MIKITIALLLFAFIVSANHQKRGLSFSCDGVAEGTPCINGNLCQESTCIAGVCTFQMNRTCDDSNACTTDTCDSTIGCIHINQCSTSSSSSSSSTARTRVSQTSEQEPTSDESDEVTNDPSSDATVDSSNNNSNSPSNTHNNTASQSPASILFAPFACISALFVLLI